MTKQGINEYLASLKWDGVNRLPTLIDSLKQINQLDLIDAGKRLGIEDPITAYEKNNAISVCLRTCARKIARKRIKHHEQIDFKRRQAGDID